jgi:protein involved in temperature-dependent protein secretion
MSAAAEDPCDHAPRYIWAAYPVKSGRPFTAHGAAATADEAREDAEDAMTRRPGESGFAVILAHDADDKVGRPAGDGVYRWTPYRHPWARP